MRLEALADSPPDVLAAGVLLDRVDAALAGGFSRLGPINVAALTDLGAALAGTPLADWVGSSMSELGRGAFGAESIAAFAAARQAIEGARYDALTEHACAAVGRAVPPADGPGWSPTPHPRLEAVQQWLVELAVRGLAQVAPADALAFQGALESLQDEPVLARHAAALTGLWTELLARRGEPDVTRLADLWMRAMLLAQGAEARDFTPWKGQVRWFGVTVRHNAQLVSATGHGIADGSVVRVSASAWKVDVMRGPTLGIALRAAHPELYEAFTELRAIDVDGARSGADLLPTSVKVGGLCDPMAVADELATAAASRMPPAERHPVHVYVPVVLEGTASADGLGGLPWSARSAIPLDGPVRGVFAIRFDGRYELEPLAVRIGSGKKQSVVHGGQALLPDPKAKPKDDPLLILRERASRLLRGKK